MAYTVTTRKYPVLISCGRLSPVGAMMAANIWTPFEVATRIYGVPAGGPAAERLLTGLADERHTDVPDVAGLARMTGVAVDCLYTVDECIGYGRLYTGRHPDALWVAVWYGPRLPPPWSAAAAGDRLPAYPPVVRYGRGRHPATRFMDLDAAPADRDLPWITMFDAARI